MAMFDFKCNKCDYTDEFIVSPSVKDPIPKVCPKCKKGKLKRQYTQFKGGMDFIGPGFYVNDYGKKNWRKGKTALEQASYLTKGDDGKYENPY